MSKRRKGFFAGAAFGAVVASIATLLFAPKAGKELRADIARKASEVSNDLDKKIAKAKKDTEGLNGEAKEKQLRLIKKAEELKFTLKERSKDFSKSSKKITRVVARETDKMIQDGKALLFQLDEHKHSAMKDARKFIKKAGTAGGRVARSASKELQKDLGKAKK